ncbi:hypothetical protein CC2G_010191 [Coprinopsis cinerea AmutBmut pab1-1]|nr:hypothetical protein CC2G_010191 [Coprinopsis cinerea AmutBmut pab1-1]
MSSSIPVAPPMGPEPSDSYKANNLPPPYTEFYVGPSTSTPTGALNAVQRPLSSPGGRSPPLPSPQQPHTATPGTHHYPNSQFQANTAQGPRSPVPQHPNPVPGPQQHYQFGPTPINDRQVLLPYAFYTERSIVDARARWRFCEALLWALGIYFGIALLIGAETLGDGWLLILTRIRVDGVVAAAS